MTDSQQQPAAQSSSGQRSILLSVPYELRLMIYDELFPARRSTIHVSHEGDLYPTGLIRTCRQIYEETSLRIQRIFAENAISLHANLDETDRLGVLEYTEQGCRNRPAPFSDNAERFLDRLGLEGRSQVRNLIVDYAEAFSSDFPEILEYLMENSARPIRSYLRAAMIPLISKKIRLTYIRLRGMHLTTLKLSLPGLDEPTDLALTASAFRENRTALFERIEIHEALMGIRVSELFELESTTDFDGAEMVARQMGVRKLVVRWKETDWHEFVVNPTGNLIVIGPAMPVVTLAILARFGERGWVFEHEEHSATMNFDVE